MASIALLIVRLTLGLSFIGHGAQKLLGWFGGAGFAATAKGYEERMGMRPGSFYAALAGGGEFLGGLLVALGLFTPLGALLIAATHGRRHRQSHRQERLLGQQEWLGVQLPHHRGLHRAHPDWPRHIRARPCDWA